jgi:hypothetical protein
MSEKFEQEEARADVYPMVKYWVENHETNLEKTRGIATLLYIWNTGYYGRAGIGFQGAVRNAEEVLGNKKFHELFNHLKHFNLLNINFDISNKEIVDIFQNARKSEGLGPTGVSKVLSILNPQLFVMWDKEICDHYHSLHRMRGQYHQKASGECYFEFLKDMQHEANEFITYSSKEEIENGLCEISGYNKPIAKALDEFNYMIYTIPEKKSRKRTLLRRAR